MGVFIFYLIKFLEIWLFYQILNQELDFAVGTRPDTKLCQILDQELKTFPDTRSSSSGTKLSTLIVLFAEMKIKCIKYKIYLSESFEYFFITCK